MTTAAVYLRQSLDRTGDALAVARQRKDCRALCERRGWTPVEYVDNDTSASSGKRRPAYERMLSDIRDGKIGAVVAWDLDRLHRRPIELESFIDLADQHRLDLATVTGDVDLSTDNGRLFARIKGAVARAEVERKSARQKAAARQKAEQGRPQWAEAFGYDEHRQPDPITAPLVREGYAAVLAGGSLGAIARDWNAAGAHGVKGRPWTASTVSQFLRKPRNAGLREYAGEIVGKGTWPALVDEPTWRAAQSVLNAPGRAPGRKACRRHLLTSLLYCGVCGGLLSGYHANGGASAYRCKACLRCSIRADRIEPMVRTLLAGRLAQPDAADLLRADDDDIDHVAIESESRSLLARLNEIADAFADGELTREQAKRATGKVRQRLDALERQQQDAARVSAFADIPLGTDGVADALARLSPDRFRALVESLVEITVQPIGKRGNTFDPNRVTVEWRK